jgi:hypothetical protein
MFITGLIAAAGMIFLLLKFDLAKVASLGAVIDIVITFFFIWIFAGTFAGMMAGLMGGVIISMFLLIARRLTPRKELKFVKTDKFPFRTFKWVRV